MIDLHWEMKSADMDHVKEMAAIGFNHEQALKEHDLALAALQKSMEKSHRHSEREKKVFKEKIG